MRLIFLIPESVLEAPERLFLKAATILIGIGILVNNHRESSPISTLPDLVVYELAFGFILGGGAAIWGITCKYRSLERLGLAATAFASLSYAAVVFLLVGFVGSTTILIFLGLAGASLTRLLVSSLAVRMIEQAAKDIE